MQAFLQGKIKVKTIDYHELVRFCCAFIDVEKLSGLAEALMAGISWHGLKSSESHNDIAIIPLTVEDSLTKAEKKIGILAIVKKGQFTPEDLRLVSFFARNAASRLEEIRIKEKLRESVREAKGYAAELEKMQPLILEEERRKAFEILLFHHHPRS